MKHNKISGNRTQHVTVKYPWIKELNVKAKDKERRLKRKKINEIKDSLEKLSYRAVEKIDLMIKAMVDHSTSEDDYKEERRI